MTSCTDDGATEGTTAVAIKVGEASRLHGKAGVEFVDPRPAEMISATTGKVPGARLISIGDIEAGNLPPALADRTLHIVTTCLAGPMAARAAAAFARHGFARVSWIDGGTEAWLAAGNRTVR